MLPPEYGRPYSTGSARHYRSTDVRTRMEVRTTAGVRTSVLIVEAQDLMRSGAENALRLPWRMAGCI